MSQNGYIIKAVVLAIGLLLALNNYAATLSSIQKGTTTLTAGSGSVTQAITAVALSQSFLVYSIRTNSNQPGQFQVSGTISATNQLTFTRFDVAGTPAVTIEWQVFSFSSGVFVQRGVVTGLPAAGTNVTLGTAVTLSESFVLLNMRKDGGQYGTDDAVNGDLTTGNNLYIDRQGGGANPQNVYWQVIEWTGASVQKVSATLSAGVDSLAVTLSSSVDKDKTFVVGEHQVDGNVNADDLPATELLDDNTLIFTRTGTTANFDFICYVVELSDNTDVVHGAIRMLASENNVSTTICSVTAASSGIINGSNFNRAGVNCQGSDDHMGYSWATLALTNSTTVTAQRASTGFALRIPFQVLEFTAATPSGCGSVEPGDSTPRTGTGLCSVTLPIELLSFNATLMANYVDVNWETAVEINNDYFTIEKSIDGINFKELAQVQGAGNSNQVLNYNYKDEQLYVGVSYYRLKQTDFNGDYTYSELVVVNNNKLSQITIYPNPAFNNMNVVVSSYRKQTAFIQMFNNVGQLVFSLNREVSNGLSEFNIPIEYLNAGVYNVSVTMSNGVHYNQKQIIN